MRITDLQEDGSGGFTGSANIAGNAGPSLVPMQRRKTGRNGDYEWHNAVRDERKMLNSPEYQRKMELAKRQGDSLGAAKAKLAKQRSFLGRLKSFLSRRQNRNFRISESFDMQDVMSRLSGLEHEGNAGDATVSFGIEDDEGNLMKVTVRSDQAEEFEEALANELADAAQRKEVTGEKIGISMAELLLKLNDQFEIVDASFPTIPVDGVYNADKVQYGVADTGQEQLGGDDNLDAFPDGMPDDGIGGDPMGAPQDAGMGGAPLADDGMGGEGDLGTEAPMGEEGEEEFTDADGVENFPEDMPSDNPEQNTLTAILDMLKAEAETRRAEADARAEEARAKQAEFTAMATKNAVAQEEEVARMEAEIEARKVKEKDAKRISDLARYRVSTASGLGENARPTFGKFLEIITEFEEFDTVQSLSKQRSTLRQKYAIQPGDSPETIAYKREALTAANNELTAKIRHANAAARFKAAEERAAKKQPKQPQQSMTPQQQQMQQAQQAAMTANGNPNAL